MLAPVGSPPLIGSWATATTAVAIRRCGQVVGLAEWHMLPSWLPPTYVPECLLLACWGLGLATLWPLCSSQLRRPVTDVEPQRRFGPFWSILAVRIGSPRRISDLCRQAAKSLAPVVVTPAAIVAIPRNGSRWYLNVVLASFRCQRVRQRRRRPHGYRCHPTGRKLLVS